MGEGNTGEPSVSIERFGGPTLEQYVRLGVDLGQTPVDQVNAVLARVGLSRATWATWAAVDQSYRTRCPREPAFQAALTAALAAERARRAEPSR